MTHNEQTLIMAFISLAVMVILSIYTINDLRNDIAVLEARTVKPTMKSCNALIFEELSKNEGFILSTQLPVRKP